MKFSDYLKFEVFRQFRGFDNEEDNYIIEIFNTKLNVKEKSTSMFDFETEFFIDGSKYNFIGYKLKEDTWSIGYTKNSDFEFKKWDSKRFVGDVFTGVFESLRMLIEKHDEIKLFVFKTERENKHLIKFYRSRIFKRYLETHFKFKLEKELDNEWLYRRTM